jgi:hypothetical protein
MNGLREMHGSAILKLPKKPSTSNRLAVHPRDVRFSTESGHCRATVGCPLCAKGGHYDGWNGIYLHRQKIAEAHTMFAE